MRLKTTLLILCIVVVNACSPTPQVTATPEATVTMTPPPPTHTPSPTETQTPTATATELVSETAITTTIEGNPFSGEGIELKKLNEITLSPEGDDLMHMADILDQLAAEGKITVKPVTDQRGAMQLGPSADKVPDLVIQDENTAVVNKYGYQPMMVVQDYDLSTFRWQEVSTRPVLIGFNNVDGGVIFAQMMVDGSGELKTTGWMLTSTERLDQYGGIQDLLSYDNFLRKRLPIPYDFKDVTACVDYLEDEGMRGVCEQVVANRKALRTAYEAMVRTGEVQINLRNGQTPDGKTLVTVFGTIPAHK